jgi:hypothetical protein
MDLKILTMWKRDNLESLILFFLLMFRRKKKFQPYISKNRTDYRGIGLIICNDLDGFSAMFCLWSHQIGFHIKNDQKHDLSEIIRKLGSDPKTLKITKW